MQKSAGITASRPLRFNNIENQIFVTLKQQPVLSLLTPAGRSPKKLGNSKIMAPRNIIYSNNASFDLNIPGLLGEHRLPFQT